EEHNSPRAFSENAVQGGREMQNQQKLRCARNDLSVLESQTSSHATDLIKVHTFGGRGSPSFLSFRRSKEWSRAPAVSGERWPLRDFRIPSMTCVLLGRRP